MNRYLSIIALLLACLALICTAHGDGDATPITLVIAPDGSDDWSGAIASPAEDRTDGPFATIVRAQQELRDLRRRGLIRGPIIIELRGGLYRLSEPIVFTPEDSGTAAAPVTWRAAEGERPVLSGGRRITGWRIDQAGRWRVNLPRVASGQWSFSQLWVDEQRRFRPRVPAKGYFRIAEQVEPTEASAGKGHDRLGYREGDIDPVWRNLGEVEVHAFHIWSASRMRMAEIDVDHHVVTFTGPTRTMNRWGAFLAGHRYRIVNVAEALDEPGEWYLDRESGELTYIPMPGETPENTTVIAPMLGTLLRFEGDIADRRFVEHIRLEGLTLAHANWTLPPGGQSFPQAEVHLGAAIEAVGARHVTFDTCAARHVGGYGIALGAGSRHNAIERCELVDLGAGGVKIGTGGGRHSWMINDYDPDDPESEVLHNSVRDCLIAHGGRLHPAAVGIWIGHASHTTIAHNDIFDFYYTGVSVGWTWGYAEPSRAHHNEIAHNHIHTIGQGVLSDMAGVYTLGVSPGTTVHHNIVRDVHALDYGGWGLYTDEGSTGIIMSHNLVLRTKTGGFHQHYGKENVIVNNIFAEAQVQQLQRTRTEAHLSFSFQRNIVYWTNDSPLMGSNWRDDNFVTESNLYWNPAHSDIRFPGDLTLQQWRQQRGKDLDSIIADPLFVEPAAGDFRLRESSPAFKLGFESWDLRAAGRRGDPVLTKGLPPVPAGFD